MPQSESRVEHDARRQRENAAKRVVRGGLRATARCLAQPFCRSSLDLAQETRTAAQATEYQVGDAFSGVRNPALDLRQHKCLAGRGAGQPLPGRVLAEMLRVQDDEAFHAYMGDNQAMVIPKCVSS